MSRSRGGRTSVASRKSAAATTKKPPPPIYDYRSKFLHEIALSLREVDRTPRRQLPSPQGGCPAPRRSKIPTPRGRRSPPLRPPECPAPKRAAAVPKPPSTRIIPLGETDFDDLLTFDVSSESASPSPRKSPRAVVQLQGSPKRPTRRTPVTSRKPAKKRSENDESFRPVRCRVLQETEPATLIQLDEPSDLIAFDDAEHLTPVVTKQPRLNPDLLGLFTPFTIDDFLDLPAVAPVPFSVKNFVHALFGVPCVVPPGGNPRAAVRPSFIVEIKVIRDDGSSTRVLPVELNEYGGGRLWKEAVNRGTPKEDVLPVTVEDLEAAFGQKGRRNEDDDLLLFCP